jgi:hypothetical protein
VPQILYIQTLYIKHAKIGDGSLDPLFRNSHCNATLSKREVAIDVRREDVRIKTVDV